MRYQSILSAKVEREQAKAEKEEKIKMEAGIESDNVNVRVKGAKDYVFGLFGVVRLFSFIILIFIGIVTIINPISRSIIMQLLQQIMA